MQGNRKGILLAVFSAMCFSSAPILAKLTYSTGLPWQVLIFYRNVIPTAFLVLLFLLKDRSIFVVPKSKWPFMILSGLGFAIASIFYFVGLSMVPAIVSIVMMYTMTAFIVIIARLFLKEPLTLPKVIAVLMTFTGILLVLQVRGDDFLNLPLLGVAIALAAGLITAIYTVTSQYLSRSCNGITITIYNFVISAIICTILFLPKALAIAVPPQAWLGLLSMAIVPCLIGYLLYFTSLQYIGASKLGILMMLDPVISIAMSVSILNESMNLLRLLGCLLIVVGVVVIEKGPQWLRRLRGEAKIP